MTVDDVSCKRQSDTPIFDDLAADHAHLLDGLSEAGPIAPEREPPLVEDVALPTLANGEEQA